MKNIVHLGKRWLKSSPGFTLAELMIAMAVGSLVIGGVFVVWYQLFSVTATNSNYMAAFRQVQNGGDWISGDALMTQGVYDMASATLTSDVDPGDNEIPVDNIEDFPPSGVICIEDELIKYTGVDYDNSKFTGCTWESTASDPDGLKAVTVFLSLNWTIWSGDQHQVVYNLKVTSQELMRSNLINGSLETSTVIAEAIVVDETKTNSVWDYDDKELTVEITASVGGYVLGKHGVQSETATRTYKVHPRPLF